MNPKLLHPMQDYVTREEFNDLKVGLDENFSKIDRRFNEMKSYVDEGFDKMEQYIDGSFSEFEERIDKKMDQKLFNLKTELIEHINTLKK